VQGDETSWTFFVGVEDMERGAGEDAQAGGKVVQEPVSVPGADVR
jgi:predicted enzyme related to lactoylglutathione lyase